MTLPPKVKIVEVGPRDGLQNEQQPLPVDVKVALIEQLATSGLPVIEAGSFVSPRHVPQMADTAEVLARLRRRPQVRYPVLVPNMPGLNMAIEAGAADIAIFVSASETFSQRNINCSIAESLERYAAVVEKAQSRGLHVRGYVSCVLGCPYEGDIAADQVAGLTGSLLDLGCEEISLGDTIGTGTPKKTRALIETVSRKAPLGQLAGHFHDTYGQALANILAALQTGMSTFDSSVAGLGGCPFAPGAAGNVATEDLLYMLHGMGIETGVDLDRVADAGRSICRRLGREPTSRVSRALHPRQA